MAETKAEAPKMSGKAGATDAPTGTATAQATTPAAPASVVKTPEEKLADVNIAITALEKAGIKVIPESLLNERTQIEKAIKAAEVERKYQKLKEFMGTKAVEIQALGMETGSYAVGIEVDATGKVTISAKGGNRAVSVGTSGTGKGGKKRSLKIDGVTYESASAACKALGLEVGGDSAKRVLDKSGIKYEYIADAAAAAA